MENPNTWGPVEHAIFEAMQESDRQMREGIVGWSSVMIIADNLRKKGLLKDNDNANTQADGAY